MDPGKCKVELHVHILAASRIKTLWHHVKEYNMEQFGSSIDEMESKVTVPHVGEDFRHFLEVFNNIARIVNGKEDALRRMGYEYCEDFANQGGVYSEVRYCPQLSSNCVDSPMYPVPKGTFTPDMVVSAIQEGLLEGSKEFGVKVNTILAIPKSKPEWALDIVELCIKYKNKGVVAIDMAGDETCPLDDNIIEAFQKAKKHGIHRTVHAGEWAPASNVKQAIDILHAERIGHGYHLPEDPELYHAIKQTGVHFETCPYSSIFSGAVSQDTKPHPIKRFADDDMNFSISSDDPNIFCKSLSDNYRFCQNSLGLSAEQIIKSNFNAARSAFVNESERRSILNKLESEYNASY